MSLRTMELHETSDANCQVKLTIPVDVATGKYRIIVLIEPEEQVDVRRSSTWPPGAFESIAGQWEGDFVEESEGPLQERDPL